MQLVFFFFLVGVAIICGRKGRRLMSSHWGRRRWKKEEKEKNKQNFLFKVSDNYRRHCLLLVEHRSTRNKSFGEGKKDKRKDIVRWDNTALVLSFFYYITCLLDYRTNSVNRHNLEEFLFFIVQIVCLSLL